MRKLILFIFLSPISVFGAGINFYSGTWKQVLTEAQKQKKTIFIDIYTTWCGPCKQMSNYVFTESKVGDKFNTSFINYKIDAEKGEGTELAARFGVLAYPTYLFVSPEGELVYRSMGSMSADKFLIEADKALEFARVYSPIAVMDREYQAGKRTPEFLYEYLKRRNMSNADNTVLTDEYIKAINQSEYKTEKVLSVIAPNVNSIDSKAFDILVGSLSRFMNLTNQQQKSVLQGISKAKISTLRKAIETRDKTLLEKLIDVVYKTSYTPNGAKNEEKQFRLDFAKATKDGENYKKIAVMETAILMKKNKADLQKETERMYEALKEKQLDETSTQYKMIYENLKDGATKSTAYQLNEYAWGYVQMIESRKDLEEALKWSARAIELVETPANLDTYANIQYKLGHKKEAIKTQKQAIKLAKKSHGNTGELDETLKNMKRNRLKMVNS
jgi:thiol-disulfide isomerase/thioredoxin